MLLIQLTWFKDLSALRTGAECGVANVIMMLIVNGSKLGSRNKDFAISPPIEWPERGKERDYISVYLGFPIWNN